MSATKPKPSQMSNGTMAFFIFLRWLTVVALALWLGGLIGIGAITAPTTFDVIRKSPTTASLGTADQNALAGLIVGGSLRLFNSICAGLSVVLLFSQILLIALWPAAAGAKASSRRPTPAPAAARDYSKLLLGLETALVVLLIGSLAYLALDLFPAMDAAQAKGSKVAFDLLHHQYEKVSGLQMPILLIALLVFVGNTVTVGRR